MSYQIIRKIDDFGRVVIPKEIRTKLNLKEGDSLEVGVNQNDQITLSKPSNNMSYERAKEVLQNVIDIVVDLNASPLELLQTQGTLTIEELIELGFDESLIAWEV